MEPVILTEREHQVLEAIIRNYILSAMPTSSRYISKQQGFDLSPASIRNVMLELEEHGFITSPHTSAGRVPTDIGYRYYVDRMMKSTELPEQAKTQIRNTLITIDHSDLHVVLETASRALSRTTNQLGVILAPKLCKGRFRQMHIFQLASDRYVMNVAIDSGFVKTMAVEFETGVPHDRLECACRIITANCAGKTLGEMCVTDMASFPGVTDVELGVIRLLVPSIKKLAESDDPQPLIAEGETNVMLQPEFFDRERVGALIEILEEKRMLMHLFETPEEGEPGVFISIGNENQEGQLQSFSIIKTTYHVGNMTGSLGVIGPKRMPYPFLVSAVDYTARLLGELYR
jgi:heat-inducible transcriptional repressor